MKVFQQTSVGWILSILCVEIFQIDFKQFLKSSDLILPDLDPNSSNCLLFLHDELTNSKKQWILEDVMEYIKYMSKKHSYADQFVMMMLGMSF